MNLVFILLAAFLAIANAAGDPNDDYYDSQEDESDDEGDDFVDDEPDLTSGYRKVLRECFPGGGMPPPPPPEFPDYEEFSVRAQKVKKSNEQKSAMIRKAPSCEEFEGDMKMATQALLKKDGKPCKNMKSPEKCRWRYMLMVRKKMEDPSQKCMMQMKKMYMM